MIGRKEGRGLILPKEGRGERRGALLSSCDWYGRNERRLKSLFLFARRDKWKEGKVLVLQWKEGRF